MATDKVTFDVKRGDELVRVHIEGDFATISVTGLDDVWVLYQALNRAVAAGATRGVLFTGEILDDHAAAMQMMRWRTHTTWLGGRVTWLCERPLGPEFRIDFDVLPTVSE
jgi:hypothetical protein